MTKVRKRKWSPDDLAGAALKIKRAKQHVDHLHRLINDYRAADPYEFLTKKKPDSHMWEFSVKKIRIPIPLEIPGTIGDAVHNLRSAYEYVAYAIRPSGRTSFPVVNRSDELKSAIRREIKGADRRVVKLIEALQPYKGGNSPIWALHGLDRIDKHRHLNILGLYHSKVTWIFELDKVLDDGPPAIAISFDPRNPFGTTIIHDAEILARGRDASQPPPSETVWLEEGTVFFSSSAPNDKIDTKFEFEIAIKEPEIVEPQPVLEFLGQAIQFTENAVDNFGIALFGGPPPRP